jgi:hypothetical protein
LKLLVVSTGSLGGGRSIGGVVAFATIASAFAGSASSTASAAIVIATSTHVDDDGSMDEDGLESVSVRLLGAIRMGEVLVLAVRTSCTRGFRT